MNKIEIYLGKDLIIVDIFDCHRDIKIGTISRDDTNFYTPCRLIFGNGEYIIGISDWFYNEFSKEEQDILIEHEYGHYKFKGENVFSDEYAADFYATLKYGIEKVKSLLEKLLTFSSNNENIKQRICFIDHLKDSSYYSEYHNQLIKN